MENENPGIIKFYADWCQPCKMMNPVWLRLQDRYKSQINFSEVDTEEEKFKDILEAFEVTSLPTFVFIDKNGEWFKYTGTIPYPTMIEYIQKHFQL